MEWSDDGGKTWHDGPVPITYGPPERWPDTILVRDDAATAAEFNDASGETMRSQPLVGAKENQRT